MLGIYPDTVCQWIQILEKAYFANASNVNKIPTLIASEDIIQPTRQGFKTGNLLQIS
jgi:hypothetical protein